MLGSPRFGFAQSRFGSVRVHSSLVRFGPVLPLSCSVELGFGSAQLRFRSVSLMVPCVLFGLAQVCSGLAQVGSDALVLASAWVRSA